MCIHQNAWRCYLKPFVWAVLEHWSGAAVRSHMTWWSSAGNNASLVPWRGRTVSQQWRHKTHWLTIRRLRCFSSDKLRTDTFTPGIIAPLPFAAREERMVRYFGNGPRLQLASKPMSRWFEPSWPPSAPRVRRPQHTVCCVIALFNVQQLSVA